MSNRPLTKTEWLTSLEELWEAAQQPRKWVGLTDYEIAALDWQHATVNADCVRAIEKLLKERNT